MIKGWNIICCCYNRFHRPKVTKPRPEAPFVTHHTKRHNRKVVLSQTLYNVFLREEMAGGCKSADWGIPWNREFGQQDQQQFQSPRCLFIVGLVGDTTSVPAIGTEALLGWGPVICTAHTNGLFLWMTLSFYLLFWTNHVIKEQDLTFALASLASTVSACCLWPLPEIHICWASCCLLWLLVDLFLLWLQWWFYQLPLSTELRGMVREKGFLDFSSGCRLSPLTNSPLV